ncbi:MAG: permease-like cell division protein FtsX [Moraxellaceae bacterium]|nr:permease-like cell division protein FtsX [Moraxellaceae bacterium]MBP8853068.1 permease-like cell division protein FtsX [Moraxellaceae bacterium]HQV42148.1 permease-like cell division protein FtsX [Moraxellaceae bacterium]HQX90572.1 permease-like cell division protein FtsX [Moraxellaceae bacterium]
MSTGAQKPRQNASTMFAHWRAHHSRESRASLKRLLAAPVATTMTMLVVALALALPASFSLLLDNARHLVARWDGQAQISLYLRQDLPLPAQQELFTRLEARRDIARAKMITPAQALEEFRTLSGYGETLNLLNENPLPPVIVVWPSDTGTKAVSGLRDALAAVPEVEGADIDLAWVQRLNVLLELGERLLLALALALGATVLLVVGNTIRLGFESRRDEVKVLSLLGATNSFIRRPFLYNGLWTGLAGGILATGVVTLVFWWLHVPAETLASLYQSSFALQGPGIGTIIVLVLGSALLGLAGAWLAVTQLLRSMPR